MKTFYRLEGADGTGVYGLMGSEIRTILSEAGVDGGGDRSPSPNADDVLVKNAVKQYVSISDMRFSGNWRFGFASIEIFLNWFDKETIKKLLDNGLKIRRIKSVPAKDIVEGAKQAVISVNAYNTLPHDFISLEDLLK